MRTNETVVGGRQVETVKLRFPVEVRQLDSVTIEVALPVTNGVIFTDEYAENVLRMMGEREGHRFLEAEAVRIQRQHLLNTII